MGDREGRPYAGLVAELFGRRGDACRRPPLWSPMPVSLDGLVRVGTGHATRAWDSYSETR